MSTTDFSVTPKRSSLYIIKAWANVQEHVHHADQKGGNSLKPMGTKDCTKRTDFIKEIAKLSSGKLMLYANKPSVAFPNPDSFVGRLYI